MKQLFSLLALTLALAVCFFVIPFAPAHATRGKPEAREAGQVAYDVASVNVNESAFLFCFDAKHAGFDLTLKETIERNAFRLKSFNTGERESGGHETRFT